MHHQRKRANFWRQRRLGRVKDQIRGHHQEMWYKIWILRQWSNWGWVLDGSFWSEVTLAGLYWIMDWIILYRMDSIVLAGLYRIGWIVSGNTGFYALSGYCLYGALVVRGWDGPTLSPSGMRAPPLAPEQERHCWLLRGGGLWEVVASTNCVGVTRKRNICAG